ncbi:MAG: hypothetical protein KAI44_08295 [Methylococcales bacterium]|nr:hypothetical protein [Methylococcales bacterium]
MATENKGSITIAILWMLFISVLLFWLPVIGPLIAGLVGGNKAGGVGSAIIAVFLPALIVGGGLFALASIISGLPLIGAVAGLGGLALALLNVGPMLIGAIIGGVLSK